ncbi:hypothetical protein HD806DRAFT_43431 [Xylariaceae sp. AK1471]|nr:hypothetical protein HD806DRAFT_43431 [Xylariaceae sp. AK1471]
MSQKITAKNLTYDTSLPPFLARLRGQQSAHSGPDPILAAHRRPGQKRSASEDAEDAPLVVDEEGNVVDLEDGLIPGSGVGGKDQQEKRETGEGKEAGEEEEDESKDQEKEREKVAGIGASRKRKVGRVVGEQSDNDEEGNKKKNTKAKNDEARIAKASADVRRLLHEDEDSSRRDVTPKGEEQKPQDRPQKIKGTKKKAAKKIKLSFGD